MVTGGMTPSAVEWAAWPRFFAGRATQVQFDWYLLWELAPLRGTPLFERMVEPVP